MVQEMEAETPLSSACETLLMVEVYSEHKLGKKKKHLLFELLWFVYTPKAFQVLEQCFCLETSSRMCKKVGFLHCLCRVKCGSFGGLKKNY